MERAINNWSDMVTICTKAGDLLHLDPERCRWDGGPCYRLRDAHLSLYTSRFSAWVHHLFS